MSAVRTIRRSVNVLVWFLLAISDAAVAQSPSAIGARVEAFKRELRSAFTSHLGGARNAETPFDANEFSWKIDWAAQQKYCSSIAAAIFERGDRINLHLKPDLALYRAEDAENAEVVMKAFPKCQHTGWKGRLNAIAKKLPRLAELNPATEIYVSDAHLFQWDMDLMTGESTFEFLAARRREPCPFTDGYLAAGLPPSVRLIPALVDGKLLFLRFGTYSPEVRAWGYTGKRFGRDGQRFIWVTALLEKPYDFWALERPKEHLEAVAMPPFFDRHLIACTINFD